MNRTTRIDARDGGSDVSAQLEHLADDLCKAADELQLLVKKMREAKDSDESRSGGYGHPGSDGDEGS